MIGDIITIAFSVFAGFAPPSVLIPPAYDNFAFAWPAPAKVEIIYRAEQRAVNNWRGEASRNLDLDSDTAESFAAGNDPRSVPRCVKLNNYWCIKGAGWTGMVAADPEGHAAFSSASEGAAVAALLLRRYYMDFSRRSAQAIVSRWAPAQCGFIAPRATAPRGSRAPGMAQARRSMGPDPASIRSGLATRGLGNTLRARFLAARGGRRLSAAAPRGIRRSVVPDHATPMLRTPTIVAGFSTLDITLSAPRALALASLASPAPMSSLPPVMSCAGDTVRIRNYAMKIIAGVVGSPDEDLKLFEPDGTPTERVARVLANMAAVEIGPLKATDALVQNGIDLAAAAMRLAAEARAASLEKPTP